MNIINYTLFLVAVVCIVCAISAVGQLKECQTQVLELKQFDKEIGFADE